MVSTITEYYTRGTRIHGVKIKNADIPLLNSLRRIAIAEVPTVAIEWVDILENTTSIHDECLSHRLGLIPISCSNSSVLSNMPFADKSENIEEDSLIITLKKSNPKDSQSIVHVMSDEVQTHDTGLTALPGISIAILSPGQSINIVCSVMKGNGTIHAKWSPVSVATFKFSKGGLSNFEVETVGSKKGDEIILESIEILLSKIRNVKNNTIRYKKYKLTNG